MRSYETRGRAEPEDESDLRTPFQHDRDRIVHSKAFRRLKHKTQVFISPEGDHVRTRLTHTLETTRIARGVARALRLNEDLVEAVGLGHDLGHPPFGHAGEEALDALMRERYGLGFRHNEHSLRVVDVLERDGRGHEPHLGGARRHPQPHGRDRRRRRSRARSCASSTASPTSTTTSTTPCAAGLLAHDDLPRAEIELLGETGSRRIDALVHDLVETSAAAGDIRQSDEIGGAMLALRGFMFDRVYLGAGSQAEHERAAGTVERIFDAPAHAPRGAATRAG